MVRFRGIAESLSTNEQTPGDTETKKIGETRYVSRVTMSEFMIKTMRIYQLLILDKEFVDWIFTKTKKTKEKVSNLNPQFCDIVMTFYDIVISMYTSTHVTQYRHIHTHKLHTCH